MFLPSNYIKLPSLYIFSGVVFWFSGLIESLDGFCSFFCYILHSLLDGWILQSDDDIGE